MKRRYILAGTLAFYLLWVKGQDKDTFKLSETQIDIVYNQYVQDGDNSAVTGGEGTERLTIYGPSFKINHSFGKNSIGIQLGTDVISSASTDNIDDIVSSVSRLDARSYADISYTRFLEQNRTQITAGLSLSIESDYYSEGKFISASRTSPNKNTTFSASFQAFNDDLRWGRLEGGFLKDPVELIYPAELRFKEWYDEVKRNTYTLNLGVSQVIDARNKMGLYGLLTLQDGLLATPFHRVYFNDGSLAVEQLPDSRTKIGLAIKWNSFISGKVILRNTVNGYVDDFGIQSVSLDHETSIKLDARWALSPSLRFYSQKASRYFAPKDQHDVSEKFYTSDFDLSNFQSYALGFAVAHTPFGKNHKATRDFTLRYNYYGRSNSLTSHAVSFRLGIRSRPKKQ